MSLRNIYIVRPAFRINTFSNKTYGKTRVQNLGTVVIFFGAVVVFLLTVVLVHCTVHQSLEQLFSVLILDFAILGSAGHSICLKEVCSTVLNHC